MKTLILATALLSFQIAHCADIRGNYIFNINHNQHATAEQKEKVNQEMQAIGQEALAKMQLLLLKNSAIINPQVIPILTIACQLLSVNPPKE